MSTSMNLRVAAPDVHGPGFISTENTLNWTEIFFLWTWETNHIPNYNLSNDMMFFCCCCCSINACSIFIDVNWLAWLNSFCIFNLKHLKPQFFLHKYFTNLRATQKICHLLYPATQNASWIWVQPSPPMGLILGHKTTQKRWVVFLYQPLKM